MTGLAAWLGHSGDQTLRYRQSSLPVFAATVFQFASICAHGAAYLRAPRTPDQLLGGSGSRHRKSPAGGCAKGIALKTAPPAFRASPATCPCAVAATGSSVWATAKAGTSTVTAKNSRIRMQLLRSRQKYTALQ